MGIDIHGWIEFRDKESDDRDGEIEWWGLADAGNLIIRQKWAFGLLFGARNSYLAGIPIAPHRGLPADVSWRSREDAEEDPSFHSHSWITWKEILAADANESAVNPVVAEYRRNSSGTWARVGFRFVEPSAYSDGIETWQEGDSLFKVERLRLRELLGGTGFDFVFELMETAAKRYGDEYVRLVVWFDS